MTKVSELNTERTESLKVCLNPSLSNLGSVGRDGRDGSRGEKEDSGVPRNNPKDAIPVPHPLSFISGIYLSCLKQQLSVICHIICLTHHTVLLTEYRSEFPVVADDQSR